jgi:predicted nucleotidyltransferase component of viral defense system
MQALLKVIDRARTENPDITSEALINTIREYLQVAILKSIYGSKAGPDLSFQGGTCLRVCYDLKRYSEDMGFALDAKTTNYDFGILTTHIQKDMALTNIQADLNVSRDKTVQKAFIKIVGLLEPLGLSMIKHQKLHIKIEVDTAPVKIKYGGRETFFVSKYNQVFPIVKHDLETLFAGKLLAILLRPYRRGRDFYDLIWYLNRNVKISMDYLNEGLKVTGDMIRFPTEEALFNRVEEIVNDLKPGFVLHDVGSFLEDPDEEVWLSQYESVFMQLREERER